MAHEVYANSYTTTLSGAIDDNDTSVGVSAAPPAALSVAGGQWRLKVDDEIMLVTAVSGSTLTVTRGAESTVAASHSSGATAAHILTAAAVGELLKTYSGILGAENVVPPLVTDFDVSGITGNGAYATQDGPMIRFGENPASLTNIRRMQRAKPGAEFYCSCFYNWTGMASTGSGAGLFVSDGTKIITLSNLQFDNSDQCMMEVVRWSNYETYASTPFNARIADMQGWWLRIREDGGLRYFDVSRDGADWQLFYSEAIDSYFTTTHCGFFFRKFHGAFGINGALRSYDQDTL